MQYRILLLLTLVLAAFMAAPASAIVADSLTITVFENGDANADVTYTLSWLEKLGVLTKVGDPAIYIRKACNDYGGTATLIHSDMSGASLHLRGFAAVDNTTYTTPTIDFTEAERILQNYPIISKILDVDLSPTITEIRFPDGAVLTYDDQLLIPSAVHTI
ncbi:hypothetical protein [Methanorbis rubei]|uniref:Uncharacterized protein n=1 Tax=Methanorbis rubei TaxID=3028300 RepID=A0AAE4MEJ0_9EURY|nr:hypothetical protein [Methanocorpusculaceae archaeon Cs1]